MNIFLSLNSGLTLTSTPNFQSIHKILRLYGVGVLEYEAFKVILCKIYPLYNYFNLKLTVINN